MAGFDFDELLGSVQTTFADALDTYAQGVAEEAAGQYDPAKQYTVRQTPQGGELVAHQTQRTEAAGIPYAAIGIGAAALAAVVLLLVVKR
jgi:hypothetical protein